jgi:hypothetical protein
MQQRRPRQKIMIRPVIINLIIIITAVVVIVVLSCSWLFITTMIPDMAANHDDQGQPAGCPTDIGGS